MALNHNLLVLNQNHSVQLGCMDLPASLCCNCKETGKHLYFSCLGDNLKSQIISDSLYLGLGGGRVGGGCAGGVVGVVFDDA